jgi:hypothetical protein
VAQAERVVTRVVAALTDEEESIFTAAQLVLRLLAIYFTMKPAA